MPQNITFLFIIGLLLEYFDHDKLPDEGFERKIKDLISVSK